jgi:superfamily I DNA/RNA helicase
MRMTESQQDVINHGAGPAVVLACAGSGKTTTVTVRAARLITDGICHPRHKLLVTFSRKAAGEMRERLEQMLPAADADRVTVTTFHALGYRLILQDPAAYGLAGEDGKGKPTVLSEKESDRVFAEAMAEHGFDPKDADNKIWLKALMRDYSLAKQEGLWASPGAELRHAVERHLGALNRDRRVGLDYAICASYEARKLSALQLDYDDLVLRPGLRMREEPEAAEELARRFRYVTVDETQDTNRVQYWLIDALARQHGNVVMVGDDDQSIYGWRGARIENVRQFISQHKAAVHRLETNYRSTRSIVRAAASHIAHNENRLEKTAQSEGNEGDGIGLLCYREDRGMLRGIARLIKTARAKGVPLREIAVLYRLNRMGTLLKEHLTREGIPCRLVGGVDFWDRREIKAALAAARLIVNPLDRAAFLTVARGMPGLGDVGIDSVLYEMEQTGQGWMHIDWKKLTTRTENALDGMADRVDALLDAKPEGLGAWVLGEHGMNLGAKADPETQEEMRQRLDALISDWDGTAPDERLLIPVWERFIAMSLEDPTADGHPDVVTLSTVHRAKGLEWDVVCVAGYSDGLMPLRDSDPEEERRLSYVAVTRARKVCRLFHADRVRFPGDREGEKYEPSPFAREFAGDLWRKQAGEAVHGRGPGHSQGHGQGQGKGLFGSLRQTQRRAYAGLSRG